MLLFSLLYMRFYSISHLDRLGSVWSDVVGWWKIHHPCQSHHGSPITTFANLETCLGSHLATSTHPSYIMIHIGREGAGQSFYIPRLPPGRLPLIVLVRGASEDTQGATNLSLPSCCVWASLRINAKAAASMRVLLFGLLQYSD